MKKLIRLGMCALLVGFGVERMLVGGALFAKPSPPKSDAKQSAQTKSGKKTTAKEALNGARKAFAAMVKAARLDKGLDPKTPKNKPFWLATKKLATQLDRAEKGLTAKNDDFFKGISDARAAEEQLKIDWDLTDSKNQRVIDNAKKLGRALAVLRTDFSKEAARKKKGGALTAKEKEQFAKMKTQQAALLKKVQALEGKAKGDKALAKGLKKMGNRANKIVSAPDTLDAFLATLYLLDEIEGMLYGYDYYVDAAWRADWVNVETLTTEWEVTYSEMTTTTETYEWSAVEESVDISTSEEFEVSEEITEQEIDAQENWAESEQVDMSDAEEQQIAAEEDNDTADDTVMDDASDSDGTDFDGDGDTDVTDDGGSGEDGNVNDGNADDGGADDGGNEDDGGADDGGASEDDGGSDDGGGDDSPDEGGEE